jgi:general secretion pathway protein H
MRAWFRSRAGQSGFTLIELMVVLSILSILVLTGSTALSAAVPAWRLKSATRLLADGLRAARRVAIQEARETTVRVMPDRYASSVGARPPALPVGTGLSLDDVSGRSGLPADRIRFFPDGSSTGGHIALQLGERKGGVAVDWLSGRVRVDE